MTTVIHHSADFDGIFCREIARHFLPETTTFIGWDFKDPALSIPEGKVYIMDLPVDRVFGFSYADALSGAAEKAAIVEKQEGGNLVWIDHHKSSIDSHPDWITGYRIDGVSACRLAWQWFNRAEHPAVEVNLIGLPDKAAFVDRSIQEPYAVRLAGEYDIWDRRDPEPEIFQFGLRSVELTTNDWAKLLGSSRKASIKALIYAGHPPMLNPDGTIDESESFVKELLGNGRLLQRYQQQTDASMMGRSFITEFEGLRFLALNAARGNSLTFTAKDVPETGHQALMLYYYDGDQVNVSLYHARHRTDLDLSAIAVKHGGGGHRGACGFRTKTLTLARQI